jgi:hypothetical protein
MLDRSSVHTVTEQTSSHFQSELRPDHGKTPAPMPRAPHLVAPQVVDVEEQLLGEVLRGPPNGPPDARVAQPVLVPADVDALHPLVAEVHRQLGVRKRRHKRPARAVHVDGDLPAARDEGDHYNVKKR